MKANKNNISLETAKLLKDCEIDNKLTFFVKNDKITIGTGKIVNLRGERIFKDCYGEYFPALTWNEILWEHPEKFFGSEMYKVRSIEVRFPFYNLGMCSLSNSDFHSIQIMMLLQTKQYKDADNYFREHCILIKK